MPLPRRARLAILPLVLLLALPNGGSAQAGAAEELDFMLSVNPLALVAFGVFSGEFEQVLTRGTSGGASVFYARADNRRYVPHFSGNAVFRYYPSGRSFDGYAVGIMGGFTVMDDEGASRNAIGLGFNLEHQWLLGEDRRLGVAAGLGGQRLFFLSDRGQATRAVPMGRLSLGWAF
jgi:hypothetical protein